MNTKPKSSNTVLSASKESNEHSDEYPHAIMFHHFYNETHCRGQGAISQEQFEQIITKYRHRLISADEWLQKALNHELNHGEVSLSFDDALLCQYDIALPVLEKFKLNAFWFIYTAVLDGGKVNLEIYRKFRTQYFDNIDSFYEVFFDKVHQSIYKSEVDQSLKEYSHSHWKHYSFYTHNDTKFRYIRDTALGLEKYETIMNDLLKDFSLNIEEFCSDLWMKAAHIKELHSKGHVIGMHSHSHPTRISELEENAQREEYMQNYNALKSITGQPPTTASHPCNSYNKHTLSILQDLGIKIGFRANMETNYTSLLELPRRDHALVTEPQ